MRFDAIALFHCTAKEFPAITKKKSLIVYFADIFAVVHPVVRWIVCHYQRIPATRSWGSLFDGWRRSDGVQDKVFNARHTYFFYFCRCRCQQQFDKTKNMRCRTIAHMGKYDVRTADRIPRHATKRWRITNIRIQYFLHHFRLFPVCGCAHFRWPWQLWLPYFYRCQLLVMKCCCCIRVAITWNGSTVRWFTVKS